MEKLIYDSDKVNSYLQKYEEFLNPIKEDEIKLLELGVYKGGSLQLWADFFPNHKHIVGIDIKLPKDFPPPQYKKISVFEGNQTDLQFLSNVAENSTENGLFDVIIDDASHFGELTKASFWHLFENHLNAGGIYIIEDWGTGYWNNYPDGKSLNLRKYHQQSFCTSTFYLKYQKILNLIGIKIPMKSHCYGMVGFIKQLIDEQGAIDVTVGTKEFRESKFEKMIIMSSIVFIIKAEKQKNGYKKK